MKPDQFSGMLSVFRPPLVFELTGREFTLVFDDGYDRRLIFKDRKTLSFGPAGEEKDYAYECLRAVGFYDERAEELAGQSVRYAADNGVDMTDAVVAVLCDTVTYVAGLTLSFLLILILIVAIGNVGNLSFRLPNMELLDEIWGMDSESDEKTVNVHINRLRTRFYDWPEFEIQTIRGMGYRAVRKQ